MQLECPINLKSLNVIGSTEGASSIIVGHGKTTVQTLGRLSLLGNSVFKAHTLKAEAGDFQGHPGLQSEIQTVSTNQG